MIITQLVGGFGIGEYAGPRAKRGGADAPAGAAARGVDTVSLGVGVGRGAGLYSAKPLFKMLGTVELMVQENAGQDEQPSFGDKPILI